MPTNAMAHIEELIADFEPQLRDAFLASMDDLRSNADLRRVAAALEAGKVTPAAFGPLDRARTKRSRRRPTAQSPACRPFATQTALASVAR